MTDEFDPCGGEIPPAADEDAVHSYFESLVASSPCADPERELGRLALLIDLADDLGRGAGLTTAIEHGNAMLSAGTLGDHQAAVLHYFLSNAWEGIRRLGRSGDELHAWEQPELERQIIHLRKAVRLGQGASLPRARMCQMYTNLGNLMNHCGRIVEAVAAWDEALERDATFSMALGNRGYGLLHYAHLVHDPGHKLCHLREAHRSVRRALTTARPEDRPEALETFRWVQQQIESGVSQKALRGRVKEREYDKDWSTREKEYRRWCLAQRLFLNDLNELDIGLVAAADVLTLPSLVTPIDSPQPSALGFFNQLKQEFVSARYQYFAGTRRDDLHFSDRHVTLVNTLDYPSYGWAVEQVKSTFRITYSLFDKIAYFLNDYLALQIPERQVSFRGLWYTKQEPKKGLRPDLGDPNNRGMKGLFWLAKDLYDNSPEFAEAIEPDAQELAGIRNHLEHKYLKLHEFAAPTRNESGIGFEGLAYSVARHDFEAKTLRLLRLARAGLIYLSQTVYAEEGRRRVVSPDKLSMPMFLDTWEDDWKF